MKLTKNMSIQNMMIGITGVNITLRCPLNEALKRIHHWRYLILKHESINAGNKFHLPFTPALIPPAAVLK